MPGPHNFATLQAPCEVAGVGLHSGRQVCLRLVPSEELGLAFVRVDLRGAPEVPASLSCVSQTTHATTLARGEAVVSTTEHLLAALWMNGITHGRIEIDGPEVPILDGSALLWQQQIDATGIRELPGERPLFTLSEPVEIAQGSALVQGFPAEELHLEVDVDYGREFLARQTVQGMATTSFWREELAPARTFTLEEWIEPLRGQGLIKGGSPENAVILYKDGPSSPLRFETEMARHKALDLLGDIALLFGENGGRLKARLLAKRAGHEAHRRWMHECLERRVLVQCLGGS